jgi:hypothetical protein
MLWREIEKETKNEKKSNADCEFRNFESEDVLKTEAPVEEGEDDEGAEEGEEEVAGEDEVAAAAADGGEEEVAVEEVVEWVGDVVDEEADVGFEDVGLAEVGLEEVEVEEV